MNLLIAFLLFLGAVYSAEGNQLMQWELDSYLNQVMAPMQQIVEEEMEPYLGLADISMDMTFPHYLRLKGQITEVKVEGFGRITHNYSTNYYSEHLGSGDFKIYSVYPELVISGRQNLSGQIIFDNGTTETIGENSQSFRLTCYNCVSTSNVRFTVNADRHLVIDENYGVSTYFELQGYKPSSWAIDLDGLIDVLNPDQPMKENCEHWITIYIAGTPIYLNNKLGEIMDPVFFRVLDAGFKNVTIDEIFANPPSTTRNPFHPYPGDPMKVEIIVDPPHGTVNVTCIRDTTGEMHTGVFSSYGTLEIEWVVGAQDFTWFCTARWGLFACLDYWDSFGLPFCRQFSVYGWSIYTSAPTTNSTWYIDGTGKRRIKQWDEITNDYFNDWDGAIPIAP